MLGLGDTCAMRLHLDTDIGGNVDDACALAMVLGWPGAEILGITTTADPDGRRASYVMHVLDLVGRGDIPVASGAAVLELIDRSVGLGATIVAIGPYTNLALLQAARSGRLRETEVVIMGGWIHAPAPALPQRGPETDSNVQDDVEAALVIFEHARLTMVPLAATLKAHLRAAQLPRLRASGSLGRLLADQAVAHATEFAMADLARTHAGLPDDLLSFQHDAVACAVALGWQHAVVTRKELRPIVEGGALRFVQGEGGISTRVVEDIDATAFEERWISCVEAAQRG